MPHDPVVVDEMVTAALVEKKLAFAPQEVPVVFPVATAFVVFPPGQAVAAPVSLQ
jgi:hypothetical protein